MELWFRHRCVTMLNAILSICPPPERKQKKSVYPWTHQGPLKTGPSDRLEQVRESWPGTLREGRVLELNPEEEGGGRCPSCLVGTLTHFILLPVGLLKYSHWVFLAKSCLLQ